MSRLVYDVVFYRVFCVTLLAVAFTFTVILTNVFIDIDGILLNKKKYIPETTTIQDTFIDDEEFFTEEPIDLTSNENKNYSSENNPYYRTKRSIDNNLSRSAVIELNENINKGPSKTYPKQSVKGLIKLMYNGKSLNVNQKHDEHSQNTNRSKTIPKMNKQNNTEKNEDGGSNIKTINTEINNNTQKYNTNISLKFKQRTLPIYKYEEYSVEVEDSNTQRLKRHIKIRYSDVNETSKIKPVLKQGLKKDDDDLYIEIEPHFDGKGINGDKKKKMVKNLIDKIQKALRSDIKEKRDSVEHIKFVKRTQDPISSQSQVSHKKEKPLGTIEHRLLDPIGKTLGSHEIMADRLGDSWKKQYFGPNFLSVTKAVNSAEMNEVDVDYESILRNRIEKREQAPLNVQLYDDTEVGLLNPQSSNVTLFLKDIEGSGFSIGFNQYEGQPPDRDTMKMFHGIENLLKEYHKTYDQDESIKMNEYPSYSMNNLNDNYHEIVKRNAEKFKERSIREIGSHNNFKANTLNMYLKDTYQNKQNVRKFKLRNKKTNIVYDLNNKKPLSFREIPINVKIVLIKLVPLEMFKVTDLVKRKRRSINVKKILNLKSKIRLNRYINTKAMANKKIFIKKNRNKRHVNNIRIIARDIPKVPQKNSDENMFFISKEFNSYADKETLIRAVETGDTSLNNKNDDYLDEGSPFKNIYRIQNPNERNGRPETEYNPEVGSNGLMSKYPHVFLDKNSKSNEEIYFDEMQYRTNDKPYRIQVSKSKQSVGKHEIGRSTDQSHAKVLQNLSLPKRDTIKPSLTGSNYRITVKMTPKNRTSTNAGFKEVHTSVNKSYDNDGMRYFTLLNVSRISKVEKLNNTNEPMWVIQPQNNDLTDQQKQIKELLKIHKKRVDLKLNSWLRESNYLEKILDSSKEFNVDKTLGLLADDDTRMYSGNEEKLINSERQSQESNNTKSKNIMRTLNSSEVMDVVPSNNEDAKIYNSIILDTIKQSNNLSSEILRKIDTNTQALQTFLQKISAILDCNKTLDNPTTTEKTAFDIKLDLSKDWRTYGVNTDQFFVENEPRNDTIPFVFAYQERIPSNNNSPQQTLASLLYHGHIHTKTVQNADNNNLNSPAAKLDANVLINTDKRRKFNESKYFMDGINNYKISEDIKVNSTNII